MSQVQVFTSKVRESKQPDVAVSEKQEIKGPKDPLSQVASAAMDKLRPIIQQQQYQETTVVDKVLEIHEPTAQQQQPNPTKLGGTKDYGSDRSEKHGFSETTARESRLDAPREKKEIDRTPDTIILPTLQTHTANALREIVKHEIFENFNSGENSKTKEVKEKEEDVEKILAGIPYLQKKEIVEKSVEKVGNIAKEAHISKIDLHAILKILANIKDELIDEKKESDTQKRVKDFMKQFR